MKVLHIINSLHIGGAEHNLMRLCELLVPAGIASDIAVLRRGGQLESKARSIGTLRRWPYVGRDHDVVMGWMYAGAVAASTAGGRAVWNLRHLPRSLQQESLTTRVCLKLLRHITPGAIVTNTAEARDVHQALGLHAPYSV
jgi:hypothetical protein